MEIADDAPAQTQAQVQAQAEAEAVFPAANWPKLLVAS